MASAVLGHNYHCPLCQILLPSIKLWVSHIRLVHGPDPNFTLTCPLEGCSGSTYHKFQSFNSHIYRDHRSFLREKRPLLQVEEGEMQDEFENLVYSTASASDNTAAQVASTSSELQFDIDEILGEDIAKQKKESALFILGLKEGKCLSQTAVNDIVDKCQGIFTHTLSRVKARVTHCFREVGIDPSGVPDLDSRFSEIADPFNGLHTTYLQNKYFVEEMNCVVSS